MVVIGLVTEVVSITREGGVMEVAVLRLVQLVQMVLLEKVHSIAVIMHPI